MIQVFAVGYDNINLMTYTKKGIIVCNVSEIYAEPVALLILDLTKHVSREDRFMRAGKCRENDDWMGVQLWGKTLGVIGLGAIGKRIVLKV